MARALQSESQIVVVDSQPRDYHDLASLAGEQLWHIHFLTTARAAVTFLRQARADLWLINVWLPDMSGFALHEILRDQVAGTPAMIISDYYDAEDERLACRGGAVLYLCKDPAHSIDSRLLLELLATHDRRSTHGQRARPPLEPIAARRRSDISSTLKNTLFERICF